MSSEDTAAVLIGEVEEFYWKLLLKCTDFTNRNSLDYAVYLSFSQFSWYGEEKGKKISKRRSTNIPKNLVIHSKHNNWMSSPFSDLLTDLRAIWLWHSVDNHYHFGSVVYGMNNALLWAEPICTLSTTMP